jgi:hypothetical protein
LRTVEQTSAGDGGDLENRVTTLQKARKELEDAMLVHAVLEGKRATRIKEHAEFIARHEIMMAEIDGKLNVLIDIIMKRNGGPKAHGVDGASVIKHEDSRLANGIKPHCHRAWCRTPS